MSSVSGGQRFVIPSLDGVRAFAIALVFLDHAHARWINGSTGVTVFFFLSGYLITTLLRREQESSCRIRVRDFYARRAWRILPPLYVTILVATVLGVTHVLRVGGATTAPGVLAESVHATNYWIVFHGRAGLPPGTNQLWSLSVEEHFYLVFPLLLIFLSKRTVSRRAQGGVLLALAAAISLWRIYLAMVAQVGFDRTDLSTDTRIDSLLFGCVLALTFNPAMGEGLQLSGRWLKRVLLPIAIVLFLAGDLLPGEPGQAVGPLLECAALMVVFVLIIRFPQWGFARILNWRWVAFIGVLSYSAYLVHRMVLYGLEQEGLSPVPVGLLGAVLTLLIAGLMHFFIERPVSERRRSRASLRAAQTPLVTPYPSAEPSPPVVAGVSS